jgi:hypothetical protein
MEWQIIYQLLRLGQYAARQTGNNGAATMAIGIINLVIVVAIVMNSDGWLIGAGVIATAGKAKAPLDVQANMGWRTVI